MSSYPQRSDLHRKRSSTLCLVNQGPLPLESLHSPPNWQQAGCDRQRLLRWDWMLFLQCLDVLPQTRPCEYPVVHPSVRTIPWVKSPYHPVQSNAGYHRYLSNSHIHSKPRIFPSLFVSWVMANPPPRTTTSLSWSSHPRMTNRVKSREVGPHQRSPLDLLDLASPMQKMKA